MILYTSHGIFVQVDPHQVGVLLRRCVVFFRRSLGDGAAVITIAADNLHISCTRARLDVISVAFFILLSPDRNIPFPEISLKNATRSCQDGLGGVAGNGFGQGGGMRGSQAGYFPLVPIGHECICIGKTCPRIVSRVRASAAFGYGGT